jgi:hypothetical protein
MAVARPMEAPPITAPGWAHSPSSPPHGTENDPDVRATLSRQPPPPCPPCCSRVGHLPPTPTKALPFSLMRVLPPPPAPPSHRAERPPAAAARRRHRPPAAHETALPCPCRAFCNTTSPHVTTRGGAATGVRGASPARCRRQPQLTAHRPGRPRGSPGLFLTAGGVAK